MGMVKNRMYQPLPWKFFLERGYAAQTVRIMFKLVPTKV
jgi:hypothetical protein